MSEDARSRTKHYLEEYLNNANLTKDNDVCASAYFAGASGTADSGSTITTVDAERTEADHYWNNYFIKFGSGPNAGFERQISHFDSGTDTMTHAAFPNAVAATDTYVISKISTQVMFIVAFADSDYPLDRVFGLVDLVSCIGDPESAPLIDSDHYPIGYEEAVPITTFCIDKTGITGTKLKWKAEAELRRICEEHPLGSIRSLERVRDNDKNLGSTVLHSREFTMKYVRDI